MTEQKRLYFEKHEGDTYIDLAAALSAANRKQYHQMKRDGTPFTYHFTISSHGTRNQGAITVCALPNTWTTRNAAKKAAVGWKAQLRHGGIKISDLPTYGRRARFALEAAATAEYTLSQTGKTVQGLANDYYPLDCDANSLFDPYYDTAGDAIYYHNANTIVTVPVDDGTGTVTDQPMVMVSGGTNQFEIIDEYLGSRRNVETLETDAPGPSDSNKMTTLFSTAEELSDDIIENVQDYADNRPYDETSADSLVMIGQCGLVKTADPTSTPQSDILQAPVSVSGEAPLGLLKIDLQEAGDKFVVDVHAITEM